jgi:putative transposase
MTQDRAAASFAALDERRREQAMARFAVLRPSLEEGVPLARYRRGGLAGLARPIRRDAGTHRSPADLVALVEGMALKPPRSSAAGSASSRRPRAGPSRPTGRCTRSSPPSPRAW